MLSHALWFEDRHTGKIMEETVPPLAADMCLVKAQFSAISSGTERTVFSGDVPPVLHEEMRCPYMGGSFSFPVKYGYSLVGEVVAGPESLLYKRVHVLHPHQTLAAVRCEDLLVLPENLPPARATLISNLETAITAVWDSGVHVGDRALVAGFGIIGSLVARLLSGIPGTEVYVTDSDPHKTGLATRMGFALYEPLQHPDLDVAFNASATAEGLQSAIDSLGTEGRVIELSWYGTHDVHLWLGDTFHSRRKAILCSQVSTIPAAMRTRWSRQRRRELAARLLCDPVFDQHISHVVRFEELPEVFDRLLTMPSDCLSILVEYPQRGD